MSRPARVAAGLLRAYQLGISPLLPRACRFEPSCSEFARQAVLDHGLTRGAWLALRRLARCHPFHAGGYDPPPPAPSGRPARDITTTWKSERSWLQS